ncbi:hypothetical protein ACHAXR_009159 [Thalassiosira sp. AJA248-18]
MRASRRSWASSSHHANRFKEHMALMEGVHRVSPCRLVSASSACTNACCKRRRFSSTLAKVQQPHWHYYNRHRQFSTLTPVPSFGNGRVGQLMERCVVLSHVSFGISNLRALGTTTVHIGTLNNSFNGSKHDYRSFYGRNFASDANKPPTAKPDPTTHNNNDDTPKEPKIAVPKEVIDAIKSEVDEMESSSPPPLPADQFSRAKKTQDDFADYLQGEEVMLDADTGLIVKRQNFAQNELNRKANPSSVLKKEGTLLQSAPSVSCTDTSDDNNISGNESKEQSSDPPPPHSVYKFSPTDATLSDPQRHLDRRRAIEQKLQDQQKVSRATTMKNVQRALGGNFIIAAAKLAAAMSSGSSAMLSEFVHSVVDCGNQALLLVGLNASHQPSDRTHPYGYGKAIYFWALVSALGTFFLGAGISMTHSVGELMNPSMTTEVPNEVWGVLIMSFVVDGYVFGKTVQGVRASRRIDGDSSSKDMSFWRYATTKVRDPATLAVLLEDGAACLGIVIAIGGIGMTQYTQNPVFDGMAGVCISGLLAAMGMALANVNHRFLIGQGLDKSTREDIEKIIIARRSIDNVYSVQSQWTGPDTFSYKAEVDFDGTFLAAKLLPRYQQEFFDAKHTLDRDLRVLLSWYAEDVMRAVEREVRHIEEEIRIKYPAAQYIELEPMSKDADRYAIDDGVEAQLRRVEIDVLNRYLKSLYKVKEGEPAGADSKGSTPP